MTTPPIMIRYITAVVVVLFNVVSHVTLRQHELGGCNGESKE